MGDVFVYVVIFAIGFVSAVFSMKALERFTDEKKRKEAAHAAAEARALSRLKRSESAKAAAERRKQGVSGKDIVREVLHPSTSAGPAEASMSVDASLYGRKGENDGLPH